MLSRAVLQLKRAYCQKNLAEKTKAVAKVFPDNGLQGPSRPNACQTQVTFRGFLGGTAL